MMRLKTYNLRGIQTQMKLEGNIEKQTSQKKKIKCQSLTFYRFNLIKHSMCN